MARSAPVIVADDVVVLEVIADDPVALLNVDMLAFDAFGNLLANRETSGATGGTSYVDVAAGTATILVSGISRADGLTLHPSGAMYVTSESGAASTTGRVYRVDVAYDGNNVPISATAAGLTTSMAIANPEGIVALPADSALGSAGDLYVCEDRNPGRILHLVLGANDTATASVLVDTGANLKRPEGLALGDFEGQLAGLMLFAGVTAADNVVQIDAAGVVSVLGNPAAVNLDGPDNVKFGIDGKLYVSEDRGTGAGRIIRIGVDGVHEVVLSGLEFPQGMAFDFARRDMYLAEQGLDRIWRARFVTATGDVDEDGDVDLFDAGGLQRCFGAGSMTLDCLVFDADRDDAIDEQDHQVFVGLMAGP